MLLSEATWEKVQVDHQTIYSWITNSVFMHLTPCLYLKYNITLDNHSILTSLHFILRFPLTILQLWFFRAGSHLIGVGGGLLVIALVITSVLTVASLLAVFGLVASLGAGVGVLLSIASLVVGLWGGLLLLRWDVCSSKGSLPPGLFEDEPQVPNPQDNVDEAKSLWRRK